MCSASHPSSLPIADAMRSARDFFPSRALPPYPEPYDAMAYSAGKWTMCILSVSHGQRVSGRTVPSARRSGYPTLCVHGANLPSRPSASMTLEPVLAIILMFATT